LLCFKPSDRGFGKFLLPAQGWHVQPDFIFVMARLK
jgi:hypothetical protein